MYIQVQYTTHSFILDYVCIGRILYTERKTGTRYSQSVVSGARCTPSNIYVDRVLYRDLVVHTELYRELGMYTGSAYSDQGVNRVLHRDLVVHTELYRELGMYIQGASCKQSAAQEASCTFNKCGTASMMYIHRVLVGEQGVLISMYCMDSKVYT
jgi:hypothetical protein